MRRSPYFHHTGLSDAVTVTNLLIFHTILLRISGSKGKNPVARRHSEQYDEVAKNASFAFSWR
jgi:hypothetical protein